MTTEDKIKEAAEKKYPAHPGKHWARTLREERVKAYVRGVKSPIAKEVHGPKWIRYSTKTLETQPGGHTPCFSPR